MAHAFTFRLSRLFFGTRPVVFALPARREPMTIEVERLPDHLWRDLGFPHPQRPERE